MTTPFHSSKACFSLTMVYTRAMLVFHLSRLTPTHFFMPRVLHLRLSAFLIVTFIFCIYFIDVSLKFLPPIHCWPRQYIPPTLGRPCEVAHWRTSLMSSSLFRQQCPTCLIRYIWVVLEREGKCPCSCFFFRGVLLPGSVQYSS